ncbi:hypothetical protein V5O48_016875, partial [Marasmius crinis-equi]
LHNKFLHLGGWLATIDVLQSFGEKFVNLRCLYLNADPDYVSETYLTVYLSNILRRLPLTTQLAQTNLRNIPPRTITAAFKQVNKLVAAAIHLGRDSSFNEEDVSHCRLYPISPVS